MKRNSGTLAIMPDGRNVIIYDFQPLLKEKSKVVVTLADENFLPIKSEDGSIKTLIFELTTYNEVAMHTWIACGKCD